MLQTTSQTRSDASVAPQIFVLVHGAWHGGWCWRRVADALRAAGNVVFTPTLTGLGERAHLLQPGLTIEDFATDVANVIEAEELQRVILVGHSFAGGPISVIADRVPDNPSAATGGLRRDRDRRLGVAATALDSAPAQ
jgi:pimeloyl-ACP methyl ester carboxylesterase